MALPSNNTESFVTSVQQPENFHLPKEGFKPIIKYGLANVTLLPLPFVPAYINGVLNRYGEPYAVIDPLPLLGEKTQSSKLYIVLHGNAHLCLRISEVIEFYSTKESELKFFPSSESGKYYIGSFDFKSEEVLILNPEAFVEVAERDAGNA